MRLGYVGSATAHAHSLDWWARNGQDPDRALHLVRTWAWSPWLQECQQRLGHALHECTPVPIRWKETAIVRVCGRHDSTYELYHHAPLGAAAGVPPAVLEQLVRPGAVDDAALDPVERFLVALTEQIDDGGPLSGVAAQWSDHLSPDQFVALCLQIGYWGCNARLANAVRLENEPWMNPAGTRPVDPGPKRARLEPAKLDPVGSFGVPALEALPERSASWLGRWVEPDDALVRLWSWVPDVQVANQREWACLIGDDFELARPLRAAAARLAIGEHRYLADLIAASAAWDRSTIDSADAAALGAFVGQWIAGTGVSEDVFERARDRFGRRGVVEIQLLVGFVRIQAELADLAGLSFDDA